MADIERLHLSSLAEGSKITVTAGKEPEAYTYTFMVEQPGLMPVCEFVQIDPEGKAVGPVKAVLQGSGSWTAEAQNPCGRPDCLAGRDRQEIAISVGYGVLRTGGYVIISEPGDTSGERWQLEPECTDISVEKAE